MTALRSSQSTGARSRHAAQVVRERDGRLTITARATEGIREAVASGKRFLSVEFRSIEERTTAGGVRELLTGRRGRGRAWCRAPSTTQP